MTDTTENEAGRFRRFVRALRDEGPIAWVLIVAALIGALTFTLWMVGK